MLLFRFTTLCGQDIVVPHGDAMRSFFFQRVETLVEGMRLQEKKKKCQGFPKRTGARGWGKWECISGPHTADIMRISYILIICSVKAMAKWPCARHWTSSFSKPTRFNCSADQTLPELSPSVEDKKKRIWIWHRNCIFLEKKQMTKSDFYMLMWEARAVSITQLIYDSVGVGFFNRKYY